MEQTFAAFKEKFYGKVKDLSVFDAGEYNLLKVVLDGLKVDYASKGKIRVFIFYPSLFRTVFLLLGKLKMTFSGNKNAITDASFELLKNKTKRRYLIVDPGARMVKSEEQMISFYFGNIIKSLGRENVVSIVEGMKTTVPENDLHVRSYNLQLAIVSGMHTDENKALLATIKKTYDKICSTSVFSESEKLNIRIALQQFFIQVVFWRKVLTVLKPEKIFLWPHYHREGCILAFKEKRIPVIELQHGLIAEEDIFYVFPEQVKAIEKRALFADEIWVYGKFWKDQLSKGAGYSPEQVKICGYYPFTTIPEEKTIASFRNIFPGKKIMLVTTQTFMEEYFCTYIQFLSENISSRNLSYGILVKLHPAESPDKYKSIADLENVRIVNESLDVLFKVADLHISVYSTTLFDALRFGVPNFSVFVQAYSDYIELFRKEGIARIIQANENPIDIPASDSVMKPKEYYYEEYQSSFFQNSNK